jgi:hypothetical protein
LLKADGEDEAQTSDQEQVEEANNNANKTQAARALLAPTQAGGSTKPRSAATMSAAEGLAVLNNA